MASLRPGEGLRPGLRWESLMSAGCPAGFPPCAIEGKPGQAPRGCGGSGSRTEGASGLASFLCCLAPEDFWVERLQATPSVAHPQPTHVPGFSSLLAFYPRRFLCLECRSL